MKNIKNYEIKKITAFLELDEDSDFQRGVWLWTKNPDKDMNAKIILYERTEEISPTQLELIKKLLKSKK
jgi:hypothetical protein